MRQLHVPLLAASAMILIAAPAQTDIGDQLFKLLPDEGEAGDGFGWSVAISGANTIVGVVGDDDNGSNSGSAYLFDTATGRQISKLLPEDGAEGDHFGRSVGISGTTAIVGAINDDDNGSQSGSGYLFDISDPANPTQIAKLLPNDGAAFDNFGFSVGISGETVIVGAVHDDDNGSNSGSAYLFDTITGRQIAKLLLDDGAAGDLFGISVGISGTTTIVGARGVDDNGIDSGAAYLFDTTTGQQLFELLPDDGAAEDFFGHSVAISGTTAIVGAIGDDDKGDDSGPAYLFDTITGRQITKLLPDDGAIGHGFGGSVAISGATVIVGAEFDDDNGFQSGSAYLFDANTGEQIAKLLPDDGAAEDLFGHSVAISHDSNGTAIVGAYATDDTGIFSGSAYLFDAAAAGNCPWDIEGDGVVGVSDLLAVLAAWGTDPGGPPDFDGDGNVGVSDLLTLLANWGPCPP